MKYFDMDTYQGSKVRRAFSLLTWSVFGNLYTRIYWHVKYHLQMKHSRDLTMDRIRHAGIIGSKAGETLRLRHVHESTGAWNNLLVGEEKFKNEYLGEFIDAKDPR